MKIAMVFFDLSIPAGGQRQFLSLAQELKKSGHTVKIYCTKYGNEVFPELWHDLNISVIESSRKQTIKDKIFPFNKNFYDYLSKAEKIAANMDPDFDALNCHEDFAYRVGYFYKKKNNKTRVVWSLNNVAYFYDRTAPWGRRIKSYFLNKYKNLRERKYFKAVDLVTPLSRYEESWCKERELPVKIIRSGLDFQKFFSEVRHPETKFKILCIGALGPHRRFEDAIRAVAELRKRNCEVKLTVVCKEIGNENQYRKKLLDLLDTLELKNEVELLFNGLNDKELVELIKTSDVFVHTVYLPPPQYYGWGLVVFESMAAGLPVVLCSTTGATEVLTDGENAVFAEPLDWQNFADKIHWLISDQNNYFKIARNGQKFVKDNISWSVYAKNMLESFAV